jgi:hypothetical protein
MATNGELLLANTTAPSAPPELTPQKLRSLRVLSPVEVDRICTDETQKPFLVKGLLPAKSVAIAAGDSTIGKSPLVLQLALAVAGGVPFLGMPTKQGRVLYFDLENSLSDCKEMRDALVRFLGLSNAPQDFLLVAEPTYNLDRLISETGPQLVVIDSVRSFRPDVTDKNAITGQWLKEIRASANQYGCSFILVHHLKKPNRAREGYLIESDLQSLPVATWMVEMEGPRAFVNQTDVRIAVDRARHDDAALAIKWSRRVHGDSSIVMLQRVFDDDGEPAGYRHMTGVELLSLDRRQAWANLPTEFSFKEAKVTLGRSDDPTNKFLHECIQLELLEKVARGRYRKIPCDVPQTRLVIGPASPHTQLDLGKEDRVDREWL